MQGQPQQSDSGDDPVDVIIADILEAADRGETPLPQQWISRYPNLAKELSLFFAGYSQLKRLVPNAVGHNGDTDHSHGPSTPFDPETPTVQFREVSGGVDAGTVHRRLRYLGDYELLDEVARGGMGIVFRARQVSLNRIVAVKMILAGTFASDEDVKRFYLEAEAAAQLDHPGIVPIFEVGLFEGHHYFSMGFVEGTSLARLLIDGPMPLRQAAELVSQVAEAVEYAHKKGVIHRDLKPGNILIDRQGHPRVTDFGLAKRMESGSELTGTGQILGTPSYMPPEQAAAQLSAVGPRSDVYSLGAVLFSTLTGRPPFQAANLLDTLLQVQRQEPVSLRSLNGKIPVDLETIVLKCLEKSPARRYGTAQELADELQRYLGGRPILARPVGHLERTWRWARRNPAVATLTAMAAMLLCAVTIVSFLAYRRETNLNHQLVDKSTQLATSLATVTRARNEMKQARDDERQERNRADLKEREARRGLYDAHMNLVQAAWEGERVDRVLQILELHRPGTASDEFRGFEWFYWHRLCHRDLLTLNVPHGMSNVVFSPDGSRLAAAGVWDGKPLIKMWDMRNGTEVIALSGHSGFITNLTFSPDGKRLASSSHDKTVRLWDCLTGKETQSLKDIAGLGMCLAFSPNGKWLVVGGSPLPIRAQAIKGFLAIWDAETGLVIQRLNGHASEVTSVVFSPDGTRIASASRVSIDTSAKVWDATSGQELMTLKRPGHSFHAVAYSPNGRQIATVGRRGILLWDALTGKDILASEGHTRSVTGVTFSPDGKRLATSSYDQTVRLWDVSSGKVLKSFVGHTENVLSVAFNHDGTQVASTAMDGTVRVWDATGENTASDFRGLQRCVAFSPDGSRIVSPSHDHAVDHAVKIWDTQSGQLAMTLTGHSDYVRSATFSPDGKWIVSGGDDMSLIVWDAVSGTRFTTLKGHSKNVTHVAFSPDSKLLASASKDRTVMLWDAVSFQPRKPLNGHSNVVNHVVFSPNGERLATASDDATVRIWNVTTGEELSRLNGHTKPVTCVAFSSDGNRIASASKDETAIVRDAHTLEPVMSLTGHTAAVVGVAFSPDGRRIVTAGYEPAVKFWDSVSGQETLTLKEAYPESIAFSRDGTMLAIGGFSGASYGWLWDARPLAQDWRMEQQARWMVGSMIPAVDSREALLAAIAQDCQIPDPLRPFIPTVVPELWKLKVHGVAERRVQNLFARGLLLAEVLAEIQQDNQLTVPQRAVALDKARNMKGNVVSLVTACWRTLRRANATKEEYDRALRQAEEALSLDPDWITALSTLGVAQLRCGQIENALQTLTRDLEQRTTQRKQPEPAVLAFLAIAQHRAGLADPARKTLANAKAAPQMPPYFTATPPEVAEILREAEVLVETNTEGLQRSLDKVLVKLQSDFSNSQTWEEAAHLHARLGQFVQASAAAQRAWEIDRNDHGVCFAAAAAMAASPEFSDRYRALCGEALKVFQSSGSIYQCEMTAKLCTFAPEAVNDYEPVLKLIDRAIELDTKREVTAWTALTKAEVLLRMKRFREACDLAEECLQKHVEQQRERPYYESQVRFVRCLSFRGLEQVEDAQRELDVAEAVYSKHAPKPADLGDHWIDWIFCARLRTEAGAK